MCHNIPPALIALRFDSAKPNLQRRSNFIVLVFLIVTDGPGDIKPLSVNTSGVDTIAASRIALYCC